MPYFYRTLPIFVYSILAAISMASASGSSSFVWVENGIVSFNDDMTEMELLERMNINGIFLSLDRRGGLQINPENDNDDDVQYDPVYTARLEDFIKEAHDRDIEVYAMTLQWAPFTYSTQHDEAVDNYIDSIIKYCEKHSDSLDGIHIDVEPYTLNRNNYPDYFSSGSGDQEWDADISKNGPLMKQHRDLVKKIHDRIELANLDLEPDIKFSAAIYWKYNNWAKEIGIEWVDGEDNSSAVRELAKYLDEIVLMVYNGNDQEFSDLDRIKEKISDELTDLEGMYGIQNVTQLVVGIGAYHFPYYRAIVDVCSKLNLELDSNPEYRGVSIWHYAELKEKYLEPQITSIGISAETVSVPSDYLVGSPSERIRLWYEIENKTTGSIETILGASLFDPSGKEVTDPPHDTSATIVPGASWYSRWFDIPLDAVAGSYEVAQAIWKIPYTRKYDDPGRKQVLTLTGLPDLIVSGLLLSNTTPEVGQQITITATVKNQGGSDADPCWLAYYDDAKPGICSNKIGDDSIGAPATPLRPGDTQVVTLDYTFTTPGWHYINTKVDAFNDVDEGDLEDNNDDTYYAVNVSPAPTSPSDLTISQPIPDQLAPYRVGQPVMWECIIANTGEGTAAQGHVGFYLGTFPDDFSNLFGEDNFGSLEAGTSSKEREIYFFTDSDAGVRYLNVWADHNEVVAESNEVNNKSSYGPFEVVAYCNISGYIKDPDDHGISDITVELSGSEVDSCITDANGYYEFPDLKGDKDYNVKPISDELRFDPAQFDYNPLNSDRINQNFVAEPNYPPELWSGTVDPSIGDPSTTFVYSIHYYDRSKDGPEVKDLYIDNLPHPMSLASGLEWDGVYEYSTTLSEGREHTFWFDFTDGHGGGAKYPGPDLGGAFNGPVVVSPETDNFVINGDFSDEWTGWTKLTQGSPEGTAEVITDDHPDGLDVLKFHRTGAGASGGAVLAIQDIQRGVSGDSLTLYADVKIIYQSLAGGGYAGEEYPVGIELTYYDGNGQLHISKHYFYYEEGNMVKDFATKIQQNEWCFYNSSDLMDLDPKPVLIDRVILVASGWDFESMITNVRLYNSQPISIILKKPNGGEVLKGDTDTNILWRYTGDGIHHIRLIFSMDGGDSYPYTIESNEENIDRRDYLWRTPSVPLCDTMKVKAVAENVNGLVLAEDESDENFAVDSVAPVIWNIPPGDNVWRSDPGTRYDVRFSDNYKLFNAQYAIVSVKDWTDIATNINAPVYVQPWTMDFSACHEGQNYISVRVRDSAGHETTRERAFYVLKDTTPPPVPGNPRWTEGGYSNNTSITADWDDTGDASGILDYFLQVYGYVATSGSGSEDPGLVWNGWIGSSNSHKTVDNGIRDGCRYSFIVRAKNGAGLTGGWSNASPKILVDTTPPGFSDWSSIPGNLTEDSKGVFKIRVVISDAGSGIEGIVPQLDYRIGSEGYDGYEYMVDEGANIWYFDISEPDGGWEIRLGETIYYKARCSDLAGNVGESIEQFELIDSINDAPVVGDIPNIRFPEDGSDTLLDLDDYVNDPDNRDPEINWTYRGNTILIIDIDPTTRVVTLRAPQDWNGSEIITLTATDPGGLSDSDEVIVDVVAMNDRPEITSMPANTAIEGMLYTYDVEATDPDVGDVLTYSLTTSPPGMVIDSVTGLIQWTPTNEQAGDNDVVVQVADTSAATDTQSFTIAVVAVPQLSVNPSSLDFGILETTKTFSIHNTGGGTLVWEITGTPPGWVTSIEPTSGSDDNTVTVNVSRNGLSPGTYDYTVSVNSNGGDKAVSLSMIVPDGLPVSVPEMSGRAGSTVVVPVEVGDTTGLGIIGVETILTYDANILVAIDAATVGTIAEGWGEPTHNIASGQITVTMAGAVPLSGTGVLLYISLDVAADATIGSTSDLIISMELNEGTIPVRLQNGVFAVSGEKKYGDVSSNGTVSAYDAGLVLQYAAGLITFNPTQLLLGDVSGNGTVSAYDAGLILQYAAGIIDRFPVEKAQVESATTIASLPVEVSVPSLTGVAGGNITVPVNIRDVTGLGVIGVDLRMTYDASILMATSATTAGTIAEGWGEPIYNVTPGQIIVPVAGAMPLSGTGVLLNIDFDVAADVSVGSTTDLIIDVDLNEGGVPATTFDGLFTVASGGQVELYSGWNLISLCVQPDDGSIGSVLSSIQGSYEAVYTYNSGWQWYFPDAQEMSNLWIMEAGKGYWIKMNQSGMLTVYGAEATTAVMLSEGWNLVGYNDRMSKSVVDCISSIEDKCNSVWTYDPDQQWSCYVPGGPTSLSNLEFMQSGRGYWIDAKDECTWDIAR